MYGAAGSGPDQPSPDADKLIIFNCNALSVAATAECWFCHLVADDIRLGRLLAPFGFHQSDYAYVAKRSPEHNKKLDLFCTWLACQAEQDSLGVMPVN